MEDVFEPLEIGFLSTAKVIEISAGESHSAAITKAHKLYTWGNGSYGRLGHGFQTNELKPKIVEDILEKVQSVSCGYFHTLVLTTRGSLYSFG